MAPIQEKPVVLYYPEENERVEQILRQVEQTALDSEELISFRQYCALVKEALQKEEYRC